jgi:hypothetical protein
MLPFLSSHHVISIWDDRIFKIELVSMEVAPEKASLEGMNSENQILALRQLQNGDGVSESPEIVNELN